MNLVVVIKILIGTYTLSISDSYTVLSFVEDDNPSIKKVVQVIDLERNMVFKIKDGLITDSILIDKIKKSTNLKLIKETKTDFQKVIATINCDERRYNYSISNYLNGSGQRDLFIKKYVNSENKISSKLSEKGTYFLPFIGSNDMNSIEVILKEVDCDEEWNEDVIFHEVIDIFDMEGFTPLENNALKRLAIFSKMASL